MARPAAPALAAGSAGAGRWAARPAAPQPARVRDCPAREARHRAGGAPAPVAEPGGRAVHRAARPGSPGAVAGPGCLPRRGRAGAAGLPARARPAGPGRRWVPVPAACCPAVAATGSGSCRGTGRRTAGPPRPGLAAGRCLPGRAAAPAGPRGGPTRSQSAAVPGCAVPPPCTRSRARRCAARGLRADCARSRRPRSAAAWPWPQPAGVPARQDCPPAPARRAGLRAGCAHGRPAAAWPCPAAAGAPATGPAASGSPDGGGHAASPGPRPEPAGKPPGGRRSPARRCRRPRPRRPCRRPRSGRRPRRPARPPPLPARPFPQEVHRCPR